MIAFLEHQEYCYGWQKFVKKEPPGHMRPGGSFFYQEKYYSLFQKVISLILL